MAGFSDDADPTPVPCERSWLQRRLGAVHATRTLHKALRRRCRVDGHPVAAVRDEQQRRLGQALTDGARLERRLPMVSENVSVTPLDFAVRTWQWDTQILLLRAGAAVDGPLLASSQGSQWMLTTDATMAGLRAGDVPLFGEAVVKASLALRVQDEEEAGMAVAAVHAWLDAGADPRRTVGGQTLLQQLARHAASRHGLTHWPTDLIARLGVDVLDVHGRSALHDVWPERGTMQVAQAEHARAFVALVRAGVDPFRANDDGTTPLDRLTDLALDGMAGPDVVTLLAAEPGRMLDRSGPNGHSFASRVMDEGARDQAPMLLKHVLDAWRVAERRTLQEAADAAFGRPVEGSPPRVRSRL